MSETTETVGAMTEESAEQASAMTTVERAHMLLQQDESIRNAIDGGASLDEAIDPSNDTYGPLAHPEQVLDARRQACAEMLKEGNAALPGPSSTSASTIEDVRAQLRRKTLQPGEETDGCGRHRGPRPLPPQRRRSLLRAAVRR
jgi:lysyl-tRNA synthetase class 2